MILKKIPDNCAVVISVTSDIERTYHCVISKSLQDLLEEGAWHFYKDDFQYLYRVKCVGCILTATDVIKWPICVGDLIVSCKEESRIKISDILDNFLNGYYSEEISNILKEYKINELE